MNRFTRIMLASLIATVALIGLGLVGVASAAHDPTLTNSEQPGSVIVFPKFRTGFTAPLRPATTIEIGVTCPHQREFCFQGERVKIRLHWVCPGPFKATGYCQERDFDLHTTVGGKLQFDAAGRLTVGAFSPDIAPDFVPIPECPEGYLIAWVVDNARRAIKFDGLVGEAILRLSPGSASAYNGVTFQAGPTIAENGLTDVAPANGALDFNGAEYRRYSGQIVGDIRYEKLAAPTIRTFLTLLTLDVRSSQPNPSIAVPVNFYKANEEATSDTIHFTCWTQVRLTEIDQNLTQFRMGEKGLVDSTGPAVVVQSVTADYPLGRPVTIIGMVTTIEDNAGATREYSYALYGKSNGVDTYFDYSP